MSYLYPEEFKEKLENLEEELRVLNKKIVKLDGEVSNGRILFFNKKIRLIYICTICIVSSFISVLTFKIALNSSMIINYIFFSFSGISSAILILCFICFYLIIRDIIDECD